MVGTCFGVGCDEQVGGVGLEGPDAVPVVGDVVHEGHPPDRDQGEPAPGVLRLLDGVKVGGLPCHRHGCAERVERGATQSLELCSHGQGWLCPSTVELNLTPQHS